MNDPFATLTLTARQARVRDVMLAAQRDLIAGFEAVEAEAALEVKGDAVTFATHAWTRENGGGGRARILEEGRVWERGGVNVSAVTGERTPETLASTHPGTEGRPWFATGVSLVLHPRNPFVPAFHANFRYFEVQATHEDEVDVWWFGGGADLTPAYPDPDEVRTFHATLAAWCERHDAADYETWKATCDDYFTVRHRHEMRGVGGVFFDELTRPTDPHHDFDADLACIEDGIATLLPAYLPMVHAHRRDPHGERERAWQLHRRSRYAEFNLVYDRGTRFGLQTGGNIEAILMSMPPLAAWRFDVQPEPGSREADALRYFQPTDWNVHATDARTAIPTP